MSLAACWGDDHYYPPGYGNVTPPAGTYANLQVVNDSPDAPPMDVLIDGTLFVRHLDYGQGTGEQSIPPGSHTLVVQIETPGAPTTVLGPTTLDTAVNMDYVVAVEGQVANVQPPTVTSLTFPHTLAVIPATSTQIQVLNATVDGPVNVYLTAPGAALSSSTPLGTAAFEGSVGPTQVAAGAAEIRITESIGGTTSLVYDSGTITLQGGDDLVLSLVAGTIPDQVGAGPASPLQLSAVDANGNATWLPAVGTWANLRFVNASPGAPALALTASGVTAPLVASLAYASSTSYLPETPGAYDFSITAASNLSAMVASQNLELNAGTSQTLYAFGPYAQIFPFVTQDDYRRYSTQARLRFIQGSPSANAVDVYLTAPGASIAGTTPVYADLPFQADTGFVSYVAGPYSLTVTSTGTQTPIIGPIAVTLANGGIYTAVADDAPGGGAPYGLIKLDDL
jgi:hypothetical protein